MKRTMTAALLLVGAGLAQAESLDNIANLGQSEFEGISKDLTAAFSYKAGAPAEALGVIGFDIGLAVSSTKLEHSDIWTKAMSSGDTLDTLIIPKLYVQKGLPFDVDVGAYYFTIPDSNLEAWGAEVKYAFIEGGVSMPAVAVRGAFTTLNADDQLSLASRSVDLSISKGFLILTPYAGVGRVWAESEAEGTAAALLNKVDISENKTFIGISLHPPLFNLAFERDSVGGIASYNLKLGISF